MIKLTEQKSQVRLIPAEAIEGIYEQDISAASFVLAAQTTQFWSLEELRSGVHLFENIDNGVPSGCSQITAARLLRW